MIFFDSESKPYNVTIENKTNSEIYFDILKNTDCSHFINHQPNIGLTKTHITDVLVHNYIKHKNNSKHYKKRV